MKSRDRKPTETRPLGDPDTYPDADLLKAVLKRRHATFDKLVEVTTQAPFNLIYEWRYYRDGKSWLCKIQHRRKTVAWLSVEQTCFTVAFYFTEKTGGGVFDLPISETIKQDFKSVAPVGKMRPVIVRMQRQSQLRDLQKLMTYKMSLK